MFSSPFSVPKSFQPTRIDDNICHPTTRARITLLECLKQRGYDVAFEINWMDQSAIEWDLCEEKRITDWKLKEMKTYENPYLSVLKDPLSTTFTDFRPDLFCIAYQIKPHIYKRQVVHVFWPQKMFAKAQLTELCANYLPKGCSVIIVSKTGKQNIVFQQHHIECTIFSIDSLKFNITKHFIQPKYKVVDPDQVGIQPIDVPRLPKLLLTDPICQFYAWRKGTVLEIESILGTCAPEYRVVHAEIPPMTSQSIIMPPPLSKPTPIPPSSQKQQKQRHHGNKQSIYEYKNASYIGRPGFHGTMNKTPSQQTTIHRFLHGSHWRIDETPIQSQNKQVEKSQSLTPYDNGDMKEDISTCERMSMEDVSMWPNNY
jgi:hypothetical protein